MCFGMGNKLIELDRNNQSNNPPILPIPIIRITTRPMINTTSSLFPRNWPQRSHTITLTYPSLYGMAHSTNSIVTITTVQFLFGMEPHIPTLCMMMITITTNMAGTVYDYTYGDSFNFNMNDPSVRSQFQKCLQTVQFQNFPQAAPNKKHTSNTASHTVHKKSKYTKTTMKETHNDP